MKIKNVFTVLLIAFFLASCTPTAKFNPTEGVVPSSTETSAVQATSMPEPSPTVIPEGEPRVEDSVGGETMSYTNKVVGSEATVNVESSGVQRLGLPGIQVDVLSTDQGRFIWNRWENAWDPEWQCYRGAEDPNDPRKVDVANPDLAPLFTDTKVVDNYSAALNALLYFAEHPQIMPPNAVDVQWKINTAGDSVEISAFRDNQYLWDLSDSTPALNAADRADKVPYGWVGMFRVQDKFGNEIVVLSQIRKNTPTADNPMPYVPVFFGYDRAKFDEYFLSKSSKGNIIIDNQVNNYSREITIVLPSPSGNSYSGVPSLERMGGSQHPQVASLLSQKDTDNMFTAMEIEGINAAIGRILDTSHNAASEPTWPFSTRLSTLPDELMNMIVYPGANDWGIPGK